ncbi:hypothetical protein CGGC5_v014607 [Colletotrichum fructicola Nara gc5]|uniref:Uncharacterized protein n=1 Tax=Colletotrichum fructicola (strain Nara gc5) TaxID=1213859 RepID=A0A7J6IKE3_COLFN|nr:hypothetical protein CGGC5_v014607 [Colletotrichum fructicola Nara gc5]
MENRLDDARGACERYLGSSTVNIGAIFAVANSSLYGEADEHNTTRKNGNQQMPTGRLFKGPKSDINGGRLLNATVTCLAVQLQPCV